MHPSWWVDEANTRGTYSLVSSCVFTLGLCVWTAVHLNIPEQHAGARQFLRKLSWLGVGVLAPEFVTFTAWYQYSSAKKLVQRFSTTARPAGSLWQRFCRFILPFLDRSQSQHDRDRNMNRGASNHVGNDWTLVHGFYAIMGGYVIDVANTGDPFLPNGTTRLTLTPDGVRLLLELAPELVPRVSEEDINDKSKADGFTKLLVSLQAAWFCLQCIARKAQHLPISLLEITTGGHALYTLFTYLLWARKPMNVSVPTVITEGEKLRRLSAYMFMTSQLSGQLAEKALGIRGIVPSARSPRDLSNKVLKNGDALSGTGFIYMGSYEMEQLKLDPIDITRWQLAWDLLSTETNLEVREGDYVVQRVSNLPEFQLQDISVRDFSLAFMFAEALYGAIHALGWNTDFSPALLQWVWRVSCCAIAGGGIFAAVYGCGSRDETFSGLVIVLIFEVSMRIFLLVEAVLNLAALPAGAYDLPQWSTFIPHWA
ncbi:hypothetical protein MVEN_01694800 [Mycena venus]|uniref:Uncharacterized protein n=1 Tax=Mycena venus TaxID=2733690 RepID=A0A8H7CQR7_9AGAR|nr:hypothetical protein MVEN_01694800 [Mycena venus]